MPYTMFVAKIDKVGIFKLPSMITSYWYNLLVMRFFSSPNFINRASNTSKVFDFSLRKCIHEYLEKSSTQTNAYLFPSRLSTCLGPVRSM